MRHVMILVRSIIAGLVVLGALAAGAGGGGPAIAAARVRAGAIAPTRPSAALGPLLNIPQTWNNCGPASLAEVLAYWGVARTQGEVAAVLRVDGLAHGMTPFGVPAYARSLGLQALAGVAGSPALLKALISNGFPVIVTQWISTTDHTSHYRPLEAYDDRQGLFVASDPYLGPNHAISYADFTPMWAPDDYRFLVLYPPSRQAVLQAVLAAAGWNARRAYQHDLAWVQARLSSADPGVPSWGVGAVPGVRYLRLAWDEVELGQEGAARQALRVAAAQGANPIEISWITAEMGRQA